MSIRRGAPVRTCIGCQTKKPKQDLARLVADGQGGVKVDLTGKAPSRGAYLCKEPNGIRRRCFERAAKSKAFSRALQMEIMETPQLIGGSNQNE